MKAIKYLIIAGLAFYMVYCGTVESEDSIPPSIKITRPVSNDTLSIGENEVLYQAIDDQAIAQIDLFIDGALEDEFKVDELQNLPRITYTIDSSQIGTTFDLFLRITDIAGNSTKSEIVTNLYIVYFKAVPYRPYSISLDFLTTTIINIAWQDSSSNVSLYELWRAENNAADSSFSLYKTLSPTVFNINDYVNDSIPYFYKVRGKNDFGYSPFSAVVNTGEPAGSTIDPPSDLEAAALGTKKVALTWTDNTTDENYFRIERKVNALGSDFIKVGIVGPDITSFTDSANGLQPTTGYDYRVKVFNSTDSAVSDPVSVVTLSYDLYAPTNLTATFIDTPSVSTPTVRLTWVDTNTDEQGYQIERRTGTSGDYVVVNNVGANATLYDDELISSGNTYFYRLRATAGGTFGPYSAVDTVSVP